MMRDHSLSVTLRVPSIPHRERAGRVRRPGQRGFSLLEIVLSLSISVILLGAIGTAIDQSWRMSSQGQVEMQRQQVARAVLRIMERDLRSVMFVPPSEFADTDDSSSSPTTGSTGAASSGASSGTKTSGSGTSTGGSSSTSGATTTSSTSTTIGGAQEALVLASRGIRGGPYSLEIDGARPQRELAFALPVNAAIPSSRTSDLRTVMYLLAAPNQTADPSGRGGLARKEGDRYAIESAESQGKNAAGNFSTTVLAPEIVAIEFRYFSGVTWLNSWDSVSMGRLPRAVEVQFRFAPAEMKRTALLNVGVNRSTQTVRLVMHIPAADPVPEEEP